MFQSTQIKIPCYNCGIPIEPNPANLCINCLKEKVQITQEIPNTASVNFCRTCERYQSSPTTWIRAGFESAELLQICLKRLTGLKESKIIDAKFLFTESHSKRIRVSITLQKEATGNTLIRQSLIVTFVVNNVQCPKCMEESTPRDHWMCNVQLRQNATHKRLLFWLEQRILAQKAHQRCCSIERKDDGIDFHFSDFPSGSKFAHFLKSLVPANLIESKKLISEDIQNGTKDSRSTILVRCPPINRQDLVILPLKNNLFLVQKLSHRLKFVDPFTATVVDMETQKYWEKPFDPLMTSRDLKKYVILSVDPSSPVCGRFQLADIEVTDEDTYEERCICRSHLGNVLKEGDTVLGYSLKAAMLPDAIEEMIGKQNLSDVILVGRAIEKKRRRRFRVKQLAPHHPNDDPDFEDFLDEVDDDPQMRKTISVFRVPGVPDEPNVLYENDDNPELMYAFSH